ncbi:MAG: FG-GAP-like repeat-containing protein, partial [Gammaproteobacteria bacterium]
MIKILKYKKFTGLMLGLVAVNISLPSFAANYSYNIVNTPVGFDSTAQAINNYNNIVGTHQSTTKTKSSWLYQNGRYSTLPSAGTCFTTVNGITTTKTINITPLGMNDSNTIVGQKNTCGKVTGFKLTNGIYQEIKWYSPGITRINDINNNGIMVGGYNFNTQSPINFIYNGLYFTKLQHRATAINEKSYIVGSDSIYDSSAYQSTKITKPGAQWIELTGINNTGQIVGIQFNNNGLTRKSFVYDKSGFSSIDYPGSNWTIATGINDQGVITGWVSLPQNFDANGLYIGGNFSFTATPNIATDPNGVLPLPVDAISPQVNFDPAIDVEFAAQEIGATLTGDFNSDGSDDLIIAHTVSQQVTIYFGESTNNALFNDSKEIGKSRFFGIGYVSSFAKADFDEDDLTDLVIGSQQCNNDNRMFMVAKSLGTGSFVTGACLMIEPHNGYHDSFVSSIAVADFNEDKHQDIVISRNGNYGAKQVLIYFGNGDMTFSAATTVYDAATSSQLPYNILADDINKDGHIDLLVELAKYTAKAVTMIFLGDGTGLFPTSQTFKKPWPVQYPDMNNDSYPDNLVSIDNKTLIYFGNISGDFNYKPQIHAFPSSSPDRELRKISGDFNGDGQSDILVANRNWGENVLGKVYFQTTKLSTATVPGTTTKPDPVVTQPTPTGDQIDFKGIITSVNTG